MTPSLIHTVEIAAVVVAGTMVGTELAVGVFVHPRISRLDDITHVRAVQALAQALGRVMPLWYALTLLLTLGVMFIARTPWTPSWWLALGAAGLFAAMIVYSVILPVPINNQVAHWQPESLPANWRQLRHRWDTLHAIRVVVLLMALVLLVTSLTAAPADWPAASLHPFQFA
jgi:uncharacterized membrane protein